jgi:hypothetical protein
MADKYEERMYARVAGLFCDDGWAVDAWAVMSGDWISEVIFGIK